MKRWVALVFITVLFFGVVTLVLYCRQLHDDLAEERLVHEQLRNRIADLEDWKWRMLANLRCVTEKVVEMEQQEQKRGANPGSDK